MEEPKKKRAKYEIDKTGFLAESAVILLILSSVFRLIGSWGSWGDSYFVATQVILPVACCIMFVLCILLLGRKGFWLSALPVLLGVAFFIIKAFGFESRLHMVLCIILYIAVAVIYCGTVFGFIRTKWLLVPLFGLPLLYHIFVEDLAAMRDTANPVSFTDGMMEMSVLCIMAALLCVGLALRKRRPAEPELPKMKPPKVIAPGAPAPAGTPVAPPPAKEETERPVS